MSNIILEVSNLYAGHNNIKIIKDISFKIYEGENLGIVGESGSGKTTLANTITYFCDVYDGSIKFEDKEISRLNKKDIYNTRKDIQMIIQDSKTSFNPKMKIKDYLEEPLKNFFDISKKERHKKNIESLEMVGLSEKYLERYSWELSGGERQRVSITRAISITPKLLICDEVTSALDVSIQKQIMQLLKSIQKKGSFTNIFISHDLLLMSEICDRIIIMYKGEIVEEVYPDQLKESKHWYTKQLLNCTFEI